VVLYSRDEAARVAYESRTLREFFDFQILGSRLVGLESFRAHLAGSVLAGERG
jgi:hypothetical protein